MRIFERFIVPAGGVVILVGVVFAFAFFILPRNTAYAPVVPSEDGGDVALQNIRIADPVAGQTVGFPFTLIGQARVFENTFQYKVLDDDGHVLAEHYAMADAPDVGEFGSFALEIRYAEPTTSSGMVEVFSLSAKDGSVQDLQRIPVTFASDVVTKTVSAYFVSQAEVAQGGDCSVVHEVKRRVPNAVTVANMAMSELLAGPYAFEGEGDLLSLIPSQARVRSLFIEDGVATVTFTDGSFAGVAGSCTVGAIRAQIESTLLQFPSVTSVVLLEEGKNADEVLQP